MIFINVALLRQISTNIVAYFKTFGKGLLKAKKPPHNNVERFLVADFNYLYRTGYQATSYCQCHWNNA